MQRIHGREQDSRIELDLSQIMQLHILSPIMQSYIIPGIMQLHILPPNYAIAYLNPNYAIIGYTFGCFHVSLKIRFLVQRPAMF